MNTVVMIICFHFKLLLFTVVAGVSSQSYPRFELIRGDVLANNSFILRGKPGHIGEGHNDSLHCVTDNSECCGNGHGDWYDERGRQVQQGSDGNHSLYVTRGGGVVYLNRRMGGTSGMWRCDIPDSNGDQQSIYIYLGTQTSGELRSAVVYFTLDSEANEDPPEFTLTCQSQGGPVTEVVWRKTTEGNTVTVEEDSNHTTSQIIVDTSSDTVYNNTLRVRRREATVTYTCTVSSNKHEYVQGAMFASAMRIIRVAMEPTSVSATYTSTTSISLEWTFAMAPIYDYSYVVYYESGRESHSVSFTDSGRSRDNSHLLTDLPVGGIHTISLVALVDLPSRVVGPVTPVVEAPSVSVSSEVVGTGYTLTCKVIRPSRVKASHDIQWKKPNTPFTPASPINVTSRDVFTTTLQVQPNEVGEYICQAGIYIGNITSPLVRDSIVISTELEVSVRNGGSLFVPSTDYNVVATNTSQRSYERSVVTAISPVPDRNIESDIIGKGNTQNQSGSGSVLPALAGAIGSFIALIATAILIILILLRCRHKGRKYSLKESNITGLRLNDKTRESQERTVEEIEIGSTFIEEIGNDNIVEQEDKAILEDGEKETVDDDYFKDPTNILADIDPIPTERFPEYVRDILYGEEHKLKAEFSALGKLPQPPSTVAVLPHNKAHNRFNNIYPYDRSRVCLKATPGVDSCDYINASFIDGYGGRNNAYIAAQGPVDVSVERFWRMVWEYEIPTILMLTQCAEAGKVKCVQYWPEKLHDSLSVGKKFRVTFSSNMPFAEYEFRKFKLENLSESENKHMTVSHLHYTAWPDHGVPDNVMSLIAFIRHVRKLHPVSHQQPLLVHCSAGVGRTGTLILLDIIMQQMKTEGTISVLHWLRNLRMQRMMMVQSQQQYEFIHCGLSELVVCGETEVAAANLRIALKNLKKKGPDGLTGFQTQMQIIEEVSSHHPVTFSDAEKEYNRSKNRFPDKLPNDTYRVRLRCGPMPGSDYINASFVNGYKQKGAYIATQCPLENTVADFWRMVNEFQCGCVVMLQEEGEESSCCFWPEEEGESVVHGKLSVKLVSVKTHGDIVTRKLEMVEGAARLNRPHMVHLLQLTSWPLQDLPHPTAILSLIDQLTSTQMRCGNRRTVIMCSDGVSRTGTFLTIHCQLERLKTEGVVDFLQAIKSARLHRPGLVNNTDQYVFCHEVINMYLDNFDTYANFEFKEVI